MPASARSLPSWDAIERMGVPGRILPESALSQQTNYRLTPMPTYEYRCDECGCEFEVFQKMSDTPGAPCPACGQDARRLISGGGGLLFKGEGFYITDYRSEAYRKRAEQDAPKAAGAEKGSEKSASAKATGSTEKASPAGKGAATEKGDASTRASESKAGGSRDG